MTAAFVFDTSAYLNGARHHYFMDSMPAVWLLVEEALRDGRIILPREVYYEVVVQEDEVSSLIKRHKDQAREPSQAVQHRAGEFSVHFPKSPLRDKADPWVMAEAEVAKATVVTYEGINYAGRPARGAEKKLPSLCGSVGIRCCTLAQALRDLGLRA